MSLRKLVLFDTFGLALFIIDRILKSKALNLKETSFDASFFEFSLYKNPGIAFSVPFPRVIMIVITSLIIIVILIALIQSLHQENIWKSASYDIILYGAMSNLYDRVRYHFVIDYIQILFPWWFFNLADVMITAGILQLLYISFRSTKKTPV